MDNGFELAGTFYQSVRVADVFLVGPLMIWAGNKVTGMGGVALMLMGVATIGFNGYNWLKIEGKL